MNKYWFEKYKKLGDAGFTEKTRQYCWHIPGRDVIQSELSTITGKVVVDAPAPNIEEMIKSFPISAESLMISFNKQFHVALTCEGYEIFSKHGNSLLDTLIELWIERYGIKSN